MEYIGVKDDIGNGLANMYVTDEPIIRCRDCKHYYPDESSCVHEIDGKFEEWTVDPNGFCAWGERK